jgi:hypothetical protein
VRSRKLIAVGALLLTAGAALATAEQSATAGSAKPTFSTQLLAGSSGRSEPRVAITPDGRRYIDTNAKDGTEVVYGSSHNSTSWLKTKATPPQQLMPTTDVDIVATRTGRLIASELDFAPPVSFKTAYSDDRGLTWHESSGTTYSDTDRQWLAVGPDDPTTHQPRVYLLFHNLLSGALSHNMFVETSRDGGATFGLPVPVTRPGQQDWADLQCADSGGPSNIFVDQRTGKVYVVFGTRSSPVGGCDAQPTEINVVAANRVWVVEASPAATTSPIGWHGHLAVNDTGPPAHITGMQLAPGAMDTAGNVYVVYPESIGDYPNYNGAAIKVVHASDQHLDSWSPPSVVAPSGGSGNMLPHIIAGSRGKVDVAWYHGAPAGHGAIHWYSEAAQSLDALSASPHWQTVRLSSVLAEPTDQDASALMGACMQDETATLNGFLCGRAADVYGIGLDTCGQLLVTWPAQAGLKTDGTYVSQQVGGPGLMACTSPAAETTDPAGSGGSARDRAGGAGLAATGLTQWLAVVATGLLGLALVAALLRRREAGVRAAGRE